MAEATHSIDDQSCLDQTGSYQRSTRQPRGIPVAWARDRGEQGELEMKQILNTTCKGVK